jgi:phosphatidylglycerophosphate synthase
VKAIVLSNAIGYERNGVKELLPRKSSEDLMFDTRMRRLIDPPLNRMGRWLALRGVTADTVTLAGLALGMLASAVIALGGLGWLALLPLLMGRLLDGLDGAVARATGKTDFGGYLDIVCDFLVYAAVPLAFVIRDPAANGMAGAFLLAAFYVNGATFLGYAVMAEKRGMKTAVQGEKSLYYAAGLLEGTETIVFFALLCLYPGFFTAGAWVFGALCLLTAFARVLLARRVFA